MHKYFIREDKILKNTGFFTLGVEFDWALEGMRCENFLNTRHENAKAPSPKKVKGAQHRKNIEVQLY